MYKAKGDMKGDFRYFPFHTKMTSFGMSMISETLKDQSLFAAPIPFHS